MANVVYSSLICDDGTVLHSKHRHDYVAHTDENGKYYMLDGGLEYARTAGTGKLFQVRDDEPFEKVREYFHWGRNYDKDGNRISPTQWVKLSEMSDGHLENVFQYPGVPDWCNTLFEKEMNYRKVNKIKINE